MMITRRFAAAIVLFASALLGGCSSVAPKFTDAAIGFERSRAELVRKDLTLPDGLHIAYLEGGRGEPLVLVHGFGGNKDNFTRVARWLTPHYRVIVPDLVGFGDSSHPQEAGYTYAAQAERLHRFVQAVGLNGAHFGGNSMGGAVVLSYAAQHRGEVASLWLLDAAGIPEAPSSELRKIIETTGRNPLLVANEDDFAQLLRFAMSDPPYIPRMMVNVMARERIQNQTLERRVFEQIATDSLTQQVQGLPTPTLIVWGDEDRLLHVGTAEMLHRLLPQSQVIVMPHIGHMPMVERPQQSAEDYIRFRAALPR
jgi:pimeloyl-ACP methyl ester carboxylesterase